MKLDPDNLIEASIWLTIILICASVAAAFVRGALYVWGWGF